MGLNTVSDHEFNIAEEHKSIEKLKDAYKRTHEQRLLFFKIESLESQKLNKGLSRADENLLATLKRNYSEYSSFRVAEENRVASLQRSIAEKQHALNLTYIKTELETRLEAEEAFFAEKQKIAESRNKVIFEVETRHQKDLYYAQRGYQLELEKLERASFGSKKNIKLREQLNAIKEEKERQLEAVRVEEENLTKQKADKVISEDEYLKRLAELGEKRNTIEKDAVEKQKKIEVETSKQEQRRLAKLSKKLAKEEKEAKKRAEVRDKKLVEGEDHAERVALAEARRADIDDQRKKQIEYQKSITDDLFGKNTKDHPITLKDRWNALKKVGEDPMTGKFNATALLYNSATILSDLAGKLEGTMDSIAGVKGAVDTRLQGSQRGAGGGWFSTGSSYWDKINTEFTKYAGLSPYFKREDLTKNLQTMVNTGISYNVEQRAFLMTISDKIATTFNATNGTLLRLVRIQQQDTTAARLGMESALTAFLNNMYETTEYMNTIAEQVKGNLAEAMSLMEAQNAVGLEHTVQKWMGSMYSVGMSDSAVQSITQALGEVAAGQISSLTGDGAGNLVVMAANQAGISIADILQEGLTDETANDLLAAAVEYLADLYNDNSESKVVQQQIASVFGVAASDLKAAVNLAKDSKTLDAIYKTTTSYQSNLDRLYSMADSMGKRTSVAEMTTNVWENLQYSMAAGVANNPVMYGIYKLGKLMGDTGADISLPDISVMGSGFALNTTVSEIMRGAAMAGGIISSLGSMIAGGGGGLSMKTSLEKMGIDKALSSGYLNGDTDFIKSLEAAGISVNKEAERRKISGADVLAAMDYLNDGNNQINKNSGKRNARGIETQELSESGSVVAGNSNAEDIQNTSISDTKNSATNQVAEAKEEEENAVTTETINENVVKIYELLSNVVEGNSQMYVKLSYDSPGFY